jgi:hypothetical protein
LATVVEDDWVSAEKVGQERAAAMGSVTAVAAGSGWAEAEVAAGSGWAEAEVEQSLYL